MRDPETWYKSVTDTIYRGLTMRMPDDVPESRRQQMAMARKIMLEDTFGGASRTRPTRSKSSTATTRRCATTIDPSRLLVFDVKEGWGPLCRFLGVPQPDEPFPRLNDTATMQAMMKQMQEESRRQQRGCGGSADVSLPVSLQHQSPVD